jgi:hypothetical protein
MVEAQSQEADMARKITKTKSRKPVTKQSKKAKQVRGTSTPRADTKQAQMIALLKRSEGATIEEITKLTSWQPHTVRGAIAGALKKRLGLKVTSEKTDDRGRVYRIAA